VKFSVASVVNPGSAVARGLNMEEQKQCTSVCGDNRCQLPAGHKGKHRLDGCNWTDAGAERVNKEKLRS